MSQPTKVTLEYTGEDVSAARRAMNATAVLCDLHEFQQYLRGLYKYEEPDKIDIEDIYSRFNELFSSHLETLE